MTSLSCKQLSGKRLSKGTLNKVYLTHFKSLCFFGYLECVFFVKFVQVVELGVIMLINKIIYFVNITTPVESPSLLVLTLSRKVRQIFSCASIEIMAEETVKYFTLKLNHLQFETVRNLFNHSGWDFEDCVVGPNKSFETNVTNENLQENAISKPRNEPTSGSHDGSGHDDGGDDDGDNFGNNVDQNVECEHSFLTPCVTENRQLWLARQPLDPHIRNSELRKAKYKQFWKMMDREDARKLQKYI